MAATVEASLTLLDQADRERYLDLAIFPEDVDVPLTVLSLLWPGHRVDALCEELVGLGLAADYRLDPPGPRLVVHDVMRAYLQTRRSPAEHAQAHQRLVDAAAALAPAHQPPLPWWLLPADAAYLWRYLPYHLHHGGRDEDLAELVGELRWVEAKTARFGSVVAVEADLELAPSIRRPRSARRWPAGSMAYQSCATPSTATGPPCPGRCWSRSGHCPTDPTRPSPCWPLGTPAA